MPAMSATHRDASDGAREGGLAAVAPVSLQRVLVAIDASDHSDRAVAEGARLAASARGTVTGIHVYAARLHDRRFRQMEGGLPEPYRKEGEMVRQREVHDSLITRGLDIISDSYHEAAAPVCERAGAAYRALSPEGKNYRRIVEATASGEFDLLVLGAVGLGAVTGSVTGTVCERVVRRSPVDVLVVRDAERALGDGPVVIGLDGSQQSFGVLKTGLDLARRLGAPVHAVAAYDPHFHHVAFRRIAGVLSEEAGRVFRFKEQERLHEEIIDSGLARIYRSHLDVARHVADEEGVSLVCELLEGKAHRAIGEYLKKVGASAVVLGKTGIHADAELDIGGTAENLLRAAPCHVWLGQATYAPPLEMLARETITWTEEAEGMMAKVPETVQPMVRMAILRLTADKGHTVVTSALIEEATRRFCPARAKPAGGDDHSARFCPAQSESSAASGVEWTDEAEARLQAVPEGFLRDMTRRRVEAFAGRRGAPTITLGLMEEKYAQWAEASTKQEKTLAWSEAAAARLARIPEVVRGMVAREVERCARGMGEQAVTAETIERAKAGWESARAFHSESRG